MFEKKKKVRFVIGIESCEKNKSRQVMCREGWVRRAKGFFEDVEVFFVVGSPDGTGFYREGDTLFVPCGDGIVDVAQKTKHLCRYAHQFFDFEYLLKCDDDSFINMNSLLNMKWEGEYIGFPFYGVPKTPQEFSYAHGSAYLLNPHCVEMVASYLPPPPQVRPKFIEADGSNLLWAENVPGDIVVGKMFKDMRIPLTESGAFETEFSLKRSAALSCHCVHTREQVRECRKFFYSVPTSDSPTEDPESSPDNQLDS
jgi:hypothetical protein